MKAREKNTGKEITILGISKEWGTATYIEDGILRQKNLSGEWEIIDESESVDWSAFRREAAKDIVCAILSAGMEQTDDNNQHFHTFESLAESAVKWADTLIAKLKQE